MRKQISISRCLQQSTLWFVPSQWIWMHCEESNGIGGWYSLTLAVALPAVKLSVKWRVKHTWYKLIKITPLQKRPHSCCTVAEKNPRVLHLSLTVNMITTVVALKVSLSLPGQTLHSRPCRILIVCLLEKTDSCNTAGRRELIIIIIAVVVCFLIVFFFNPPVASDPSVRLRCALCGPSCGGTSPTSCLISRTSWPGWRLRSLRPTRRRARWRAPWKGPPAGGGGHLNGRSLKQSRTISFIVVYLLCVVERWLLLIVCFVFFSCF